MRERERENGVNLAINKSELHNALILIKWVSSKLLLNVFLLFLVVNQTDYSLVILMGSFKSKGLTVFFFFPSNISERTSGNKITNIFPFVIKKLNIFPVT